MNASVLCLFALLPSAQPAAAWRPIHSPATQWPAPYVAQVPEYEDIPNQQPELGEPGDAPETFLSPPAVEPNGAYAAPYGTSTFGASCNPYSGDDCYGWGAACGSWGARPSGLHGGNRSVGNVLQPYRYGWTLRAQNGLLATADTTRNNGNFKVTEFDFDLQYTTPSPYGYIYSFTQEFDMRLWDGPQTAAGSTTALPGSVFRFGWDLVLSTPTTNPWSVELAFNPSLNSDFENNLTRDAWNLDSRGILYYRTSPYWTYAIGAGFWDRVDDRVIPYAGFIYTPNNQWEWRVLFPESQIRYRLGYFWSALHWLYVRGEYHVEAYEVELERTGFRERVEVEDWRFLIGLDSNHGTFWKFIEAGWVFGRNVEFLNGTPGFDVTTGFILRGGILF